MPLSVDATMLRVFVGEEDRAGDVPLFEAIVQRALERKLAGATVYRGLLGYGARKHMHTAKILRLSEDLPVVVEIVDRAERIEAFLPELDGLIAEGLVTLEKVRMVAYRRTKD